MYLPDKHKCVFNYKYIDYISVENNAILFVFLFSQPIPQGIYFATS